MKSILSFTIILILAFGPAIGQTNDILIKGRHITKKMISHQVKKGENGLDEIPKTAFDYGVSEYKNGKYKSSLKYFDAYLEKSPFDYEAFFNRGLVYYILEDIDHACKDWRYATYFNEYYSTENYFSVCDSTFDRVAYLNGGLPVQSPLYDQESELNTVDTPPAFPGGNEELNKFLMENLNIAPSLKSKFLKSRIIVRFKVMEDGSVTNPDVPVHLDNDDSELIKEAVRVASMMPKWKPAVKNGSPVAAEFLYPIINGFDSLRLADKIFLEGVRLFEQADVQGALDHFTRVIQINDGDDDAHYNRGVCYFKLKDDDKACLDWSQPSLRCQISVVELLNKYCNAKISLDSIPTIREAGQIIYTIVEEMPTYQGGESALLDYIAQSVIYPVVAKRNRITGHVYISFVIDKDGNVREAKILRGIGGGCDEEALRVVQAMPSWNPGFQNGRPVNVQYNLPIHFTLE